MNTITDNAEIENAMPLTERLTGRTIHEVLSHTTAQFGDRLALSFQLKSGPKDKAETLNWQEFRAKTTQVANMFRKDGIGEKDVIAYIMPNCIEVVLAFMGGATAGIVNPINPTLEPKQIAAILRETGAKAVVTLAAFPKTDLAEITAQAVAMAPDVKTIYEVDLKRYLSPPLSWIVPLIRPKVLTKHHAKVVNFNIEYAKHAADALDFAENHDDRIAAYFHTGGTTGMPKVAQHKFSGILYQGWCAASRIFTEKDVLICPLPMFHIFAAYPILMSCVTSGAHMVMPTPQGYRGDGVYDNFWKLIERWGVTFMVTVPTALSTLMQRKVDADVSSLNFALVGSAPLPVELFKRFEAATGVTVLEGYGMTETTCLVSINPPEGERKIGSVGLPFPYTDVKILHCDAEGNITKECAIDEVGEICIDNPGVFAGNTYIEPNKNIGLYADGKYLRTGDLGRMDSDNYLYITGRSKDLIIRGGHNIDPAEIEEALASHPAVALSGAIGQPDAHSGEVPCVYLELVDGVEVSIEELMAHLKENVAERAAMPKYIEIVDEMEKTAVGKILKNELRKSAILRVFNETLKAANLDASVTEVYEDKKRGLIARVAKSDAAITDKAMMDALGGFTPQWEWAA